MSTSEGQAVALTTRLREWLAGSKAQKKSPPGSGGNSLDIPRHNTFKVARSAYVSASRIVNYGSISTKMKAPVDFAVGPPAPSDLQHRFFRGPVGSAGLTDVDRNLGSSLALAAHLGPRLSWRHIPPPGPVRIAAVLQY